MKMDETRDYKSKAMHCVKDTVLPVQRKQFEECGCSLDEQYKRYGNTEFLFAEIIDPGRVYEVGYPKCVCPEVLSGKEQNPSHCECSRQSILYILGDLLPDKYISVETVETVLSGAEKCRFKVMVDSKQGGKCLIHKYGKEPYRIAVVHGGPGACGSVGSVAKELSKTCGTVEPIQSKHSIAELIDELHTQISEITTAPITLLGHSWGAWLVVSYAAKYPDLVKQIVLVGSGPFKKEYVPRIMERRLNNLTESEAESFRSLLTRLEDASTTNKDHLLASLGALADKADNYDTWESDASENAPDGEMYAAIWPEANDLRSKGELVAALGKIACPIIVIHGEYDPHPIEGIVEPLEEIGIHPDVHILQNCGHSPFKERQASRQFYSILSSLLLL